MIVEVVVVTGVATVVVDRVIPQQEHALLNPAAPLQSLAYVGTADGERVT